MCSRAESPAAWGPACAVGLVTSSHWADKKPSGLAVRGLVYTFILYVGTH